MLDFVRRAYEASALRWWVTGVVHPAAWVAIYFDRAASLPPLWVVAVSICFIPRGEIIVEYAIRLVVWKEYCREKLAGVRSARWRRSLS